jgi:hypothetical protein
VLCTHLYTGVVFQDVAACLVTAVAALRQKSFPVSLKKEEKKADVNLQIARLGMWVV